MTGDSRASGKGWRDGLLALALAAVPLLVGGGILYFLFTISPVHSGEDTVPSHASAPVDPAWSEAAERGRQLARSMLASENLPGLSVAVAVGGEIVWAEGFGWANVEDRVPVTPQTRFRVGGVSMALTSAAAGLLDERGLLDLDAPVRRYVPSFPEKQWPVTTRQVMGHVAGIRRGPDEHEELGTSGCRTTMEGLEAFADSPLRFEPGMEFRYSTYGWILVSAVVEAAAKEPFYLFIQREVFEPLEMNGTGPDWADGEVPERASFYFPRFAARTSLGLHPARPVDYSCFSGAGAFLSTPSDLVRFGSAMMNGTLLGPDTVAALQTPLELASGASTGYGLGWEIETVTLRGAPTRLAGHRGDPFGATVRLMTFPDHGLAVAAASNVSYATGMEPFCLQVAEAFASADPVASGPPLR